jgi:hypothetical protein
MSRYKDLKFGCIGELGPLVNWKVVRNHCSNVPPHLPMALHWRNRVGPLAQWAIGGWRGTGSLPNWGVHGRLIRPHAICIYCGGIEWMCRRSARSSGQWAGKRTARSQNTQKKQLYSVYVKRAVSENPYTTRKVNLYP